MSKVDYLDDERKKIWEAIEDLRKKVKQYTPEEVSAMAVQMEQAQQALLASESSSERYQKILAEAESAISKISTYTESINSRYQEIENQAAEALSNYSEIQKAVNNSQAISQKANEIKVELDTTEAAITEKNKVLAEAQEIHSSIEQLLQKSELLHTNILDKERATTELHRRIFGYVVDSEEEGEEERVEGLKDQLDTSFKELSSGLSSANGELQEVKESSQKKSDEIATDWSEKHQELNDKIEALLPKALTAGLSHAYADKKAEEIKDQIRLQKIFNFAIAGMLVVSVIPFGIAIYYIMGAGFTLEDVVNRMPKLVMAIFPLYVPVLWVAYSSNKKLNLSKRLIEEYAHKEVLSRTYEGLSRQIDGIEDDDISEELRIKLLYNVLEISAENPGKLITDYNKSDHPIIEVLERSSKLTDSVDKLSRIPGFGKLADKLSRQARESIEEEARKAERGLKMNEGGAQKQAATES